MHRVSLLIAIAALGLIAPAGAALAQGKIGVVQIERIVRDSAPALRAQKKLEAEFSKREGELGKFADQLKRGFAKLRFAGLLEKEFREFYVAQNLPRARLSEARVLALHPCDPPPGAPSDPDARRPGGHGEVDVHQVVFPLRDHAAARPGG